MEASSMLARSAGITGGRDGSLYPRGVWGGSARIFAPSFLIQMEASLPVCVVVGLGNNGIGDHCAMKWSSEGYQVAMLARRKEVLDALEKEIPNSKGYQCDVCVPEQIESAVGAIGA